MPDLTLYHLNFGGTLHLGRRGVGQEETGVHLPADTLFAALVAARVEAGEEPGPLINPFLSAQDGQGEVTVPFLLTSAFPYAGEVRFYPPPPLSQWRFSKGELREERLKELKRIQFVSEQIFERMVKGEPLDAWLPLQGDSSAAQQGLYLQGTAHWLTVAEIEKLPKAMRQAQKRARPVQAFRYVRTWQTHKVPRVTVDRLRYASTIFHTGRLTFSADCGLWFGLAWQKMDDQRLSEWQAMIHQTLSLLGDSGLGGERSVGYGHFNWEQKGVRSWSDPQEGGLFITLSRYHPREKELPALQDEQAAYNLVSVGGWVGSPQTSAQRRRRLWLVGEGSVLKAVGKGPWGDITDVQPEYEFPHPIWRYGLACPVAFGGAS